MCLFLCSYLCDFIILKKKNYNISYNNLKYFVKKKKNVFHRKLSVKGLWFKKVLHILDSTAY